MTPKSKSKWFFRPFFLFKVCIKFILQLFTVISTYVLISYKKKILKFIDTYHTSFSDLRQKQYLFGVDLTPKSTTLIKGQDSSLGNADVDGGIENLVSPYYTVLKNLKHQFYYSYDVFI